MIRRPPRSTPLYSSAASDVYKRQGKQRWQKSQRQVQLADGLAQIGRGMESADKPVLAYVVPYDIVKLLTGGGKRIVGIAKVLSANFNVFILSLSPSARPFSAKEISPGVWMVGIPASPEFEEKAHERTAVCGTAAPLFAFADYFDRLPEFHAVLERLAKRIQTWVLVSPMAWPAIRRFFKSECQRVIYDAHDDMPRFLRNVLGCVDEQMLGRAWKMESELLDKASVAAFCTAEDAAATQGHHPGTSGKIMVVPNGVDVDVCHPVFPAQARGYRQMAGVDRPVVVFAGAHHKPNYEAVDWIVREGAPMFPRVLFVVMGMHLAAYREAGGAEPGGNVVFTGPVPEEIKEAVFALADVALAPMKSGTGSSLKVPDYLAHGKIVVGTPIGLRGFEEFLKFPSVISSEDIRGALAEVLERLAQDPSAFDHSCREAREWVKATLDWSVAARPLMDALNNPCAEGKR